MAVFAALKPASADSGDWRTRLTGWEVALNSAERNSMSISCVSLRYCDEACEHEPHPGSRVIGYTQKKAPQVPGVPVTFIPARKLPKKTSVLAEATSAIGTSPS